MKHFLKLVLVLFSLPVNAQSWIEFEDGTARQIPNRERSNAAQLSNVSIGTKVANLITDAAYLSANSYGDQRYQDTVISRGYTQISDLPTNWSGIRVVLYKKGENYVMSFTGTVNPNDWVNNIKQAIYGPQYTRQYVEAGEIMRTAMRDFGLNNQNTIVTGHSLGGGLAQYVADKLDFRAVTFNAAGLVSTQSERFPRGSNPNIANINDPKDPVSQSRGTQIGQEYLFAPKIDTFGRNHFVANHFMNVVIDQLNPIITNQINNNNSIVSQNALQSKQNTATTITTGVNGSNGGISFPSATSTKTTTAMYATTKQPLALSGGANTYTESSWQVTTGSGANLGTYSGGQLGLPAGDNYTTMSNQGSYLTVAEKTFKAGGGNNGTFNYEMMAAFITQEHKRHPANSTFGLDKSYIVFTNSQGQTVTKTLQQVFGVNHQGLVLFPTHTSYGARATPLVNVVQSMNMAAGSTIKVEIKVGNTVNNDTNYISTYAVRSPRAR